MSPDEYITKFINNLTIEDSTRSCLVSAITDARKISNRSLTSGERGGSGILTNEDNSLSPYSFIGVINYLLILDMIGGLFKARNVNINCKKEWTICKALKYFGPEMSDEDIYAIVALRNSLAHNYSLVNPPNSGKNQQSMSHKFILINSSDADAVERPAQAWIGFEDNKKDSYTKVGHDALIDLAEEVYLNLKKKNEENLVELSVDFEVFKAMYTYEIGGLKLKSI